MEVRLGRPLLWRSLDEEADMSDKHKLGELASLDDYPAANIRAPDPIGYDVNLPSVSVDNLSPGAPRMGAVFDMGNFSLEGSYQPSERPDYWRA